MNTHPLKHFACLLALAGISSGFAATAPRPINDSLGAATVINTTRLTLANQSGAGATIEKGEPAFNAVLPLRSTWYRLVMPFNGHVTALAKTSPGNTPRIVLWGTTFQGRTFGELTGAAEDTSFATYRRASAAFSAGQTVLISLDASAASNLTVIVNRDLADDALTAPLLTMSAIQQSDLRHLTTTAEEDGYFPTGRVAWAAFTSTEASLLIDTLGSSAGGAEIASNLALFTGDPLSGLTLVTEGNLVPDSSSQSITLSPTPGQLYYAAYAASSSFGKLCFNLNSNTGAGTFSIVTPDGYGLTPENAGSVTAWIRRTSTVGVTEVDYYTTDGTATAGSDFTAIPATPLPFVAGQFFQPVTIDITADSVADDFESLSLDLGVAGGGATVGEPSSLLVVITDGTGSTGMNLSSASTKVVEGSEITVTVTRTGNTSGQASAWVVPAASPEAFTNLPLQVTFSPGQTTATVVVALSDDAHFGGDKSGSIDLANVVGADDLGAALNLTVVDDDAYQPIAARYRVLTNVSSTSRDPGLFDFTTTALGACTGRLTLGSVIYPVSGKLDAQGHCRISIARSAGGAVVADLRVLDAMHLLRCEIKEAGSILTHSGQSYPVVARNAANPHPKAGRYTTSSDGLAITGTPNALLFSSVVTNTGSVAGVGFTADNKAFTFSAPFNSENTVPVLVGNAQGYVASNINYQAAAVGITSTSTVRWLKRPVAAGGMLPGGVDVSFSIATSGYSAPAPLTAAMTFLNTGASPIATLDAGDAFASTTSVTIAVPKANILVPASNGLKLTIVPSTGNFSGSVLGSNGKVHTIRGILSTASAQGIGNVFGPTYSSSMSFF
jgi:hypothetical protein